MNILGSLGLSMRVQLKDEAARGDVTSRLLSRIGALPRPLHDARI
jgi:hypothetical protein